MSPEHRLPLEFLERVRLEVEDPEAFIASLNAQPVKSFRTNLYKTEPTFLLQTMSGIQESVPWQEGAFYVDETFLMGRHPYHAAGLYYIQEASAMAPVVVLDPKPGERIIDLAAAPGGKSTQIAERIGAEGLLVANDIDPGRLDALTQNIERLGFLNVLITQAEPGTLATYWPEMFDRVLLDAPCSSEGVFRKQPETIPYWSSKVVERSCKSQRLLLEAAVGLLKPGGRLVYATCTFGRAENEAMIARFLQEHSEIEPEPLTAEERARFPGSEKGLLDASVSPAIREATVRFWPHRSKTEGQAMIRLKKVASSKKSGDTGLQKMPKAQFTSFAIGEKASHREAIAILHRFLEETLPDSTILKDRLTSRIWQKNDRFYLLPKALLSFPEGLNVITGLPRITLRRAGLLLGEIRKGRFVPAHALALAQTSQDLRNMPGGHVPLTVEEAYRYLSGHTLWFHDLACGREHTVLTGHEGRTVLVSLDHFPLGWGKISDGQLKNHYPKGLRFLTT
ncbi:MAG: tRNA/RNA cytosine-C5-methylase [Candidatus Carbobacillus altaicus]|uniref:tRNA/RNA cytosine-C5-methylase n=1 Tax=Candidatus Carbonibacillus altaicus TaxID=2163959 RepID=A0A2R6Y5J6_9BACL|nr:MAG: tRNA/RNA cytosine-C5-methylase [Candidatus Carbobacillus altaicus]